MNINTAKTAVAKAKSDFRRKGFKGVRVNPMNVMAYGLAPRTATERRKMGERIATNIRRDIEWLRMWHTQHGHATNRLPSCWWSSTECIDAVLTVPAMFASMEVVPCIISSLESDDLNPDDWGCEKEGEVAVRWAVMGSCGSARPSGRGAAMHHKMHHHDFALWDSAARKWSSQCYGYLSAPSLRDLVVMSAARGMVDRSEDFAEWVASMED